MRTIHQDGWQRRGFSLLWSPVTLSRVTAPGQVVSMRQFFALRKAWPEDLPSASGNAVVVAGIEGCMDTLSTSDASTWLETDLKDLVLEFQDHYEGQAALIMWLPSGRDSVRMIPATERYVWNRAASEAQRTIELGRCLWGGAEADVARILDGAEQKSDWDGADWAGLHHPRIS